MFKRLILVSILLLILGSISSSALAQESNTMEPVSCTVRDRTMSGSYLLSPGTPGSPRIYYEVKYHVNSNCSITNVQDRTRGTALSDEPMRWVKSCTKGTSNCSSRGIYIPLNGAWTSWRSALSTNVGAQYRHYSSNYGGNWLAYGYTYFGP